MVDRVKKSFVNLESFLKVAGTVFVIAYALFNFIGQPKKNAEDIEEMRLEMVEVHKEIRAQILENSKEIRAQDKEVSKVNAKLESISSQIMDLRTDIRALTKAFKE